ncbi:MAG TPA: hypothetical protein PK992_08090, partial [Planctomycetaceae bacterium]|nr:hypothetical protein [Planctomycetaceae bacterium]
MLHALAYLREILCHNNTNPTKSLGGSQTVNLGGFSNLVHQPGGKQVTIGARSEGWKDVYNEHYFLSQNVDEPSERKQKVGDVELSPWTGFAYHDTEPPLTIEVSVSERQIDKLEFHVHGTPSVVLWSEHLKLESPEHLRATALQVAACVGWIDVWCGFLIPECIGDHSSHPGTLEDYHQSIHEAGQERRRAAVEWLSSHLEPLYEPLDIQIPSDATLSAAKPLASLKILDIPTFTSELPDWLLATSASVPLDAVLAALLPAEGTGAYKHVDGEWSKLFVVLHRPDTGPSAGCVVPFCLIGDPKNTSHFLSGLSQLRVACCRTPFAAAWKFPSFQALISSPNTPLNLGLWDRGSDSEINQHLLSKLQALIDAMVRGSLSSLQDLLQTSIYIGPKRSTVPRHLNSSMMDEYSSWADGLGAWRWMTTCAEKDLASCARWLGDKVSGLGTNFTLVRETFYDVDSETVYAAMYKAVSKDEEGDGDMFEEFEAEADSWPKSSKIVVKDNRTHLRRHPQDIGEGITQV